MAGAPRTPHHSVRDGEGMHPPKFLALLGKIVVKILIFKKDVPAGSPRAMEMLVRVSTTPAMARRATTTAPSPRPETAEEAAAAHCLLEQLELGCTTTPPNQTPSIAINNPVLLT
jgi:hypothetical protein